MVAFVVQLLLVVMPQLLLMLPLLLRLHLLNAALLGALRSAAATLLAAMVCQMGQGLA